MTRDESRFAGEDDDAPLSWRELRHFLEAPRRRPLAVLLPWAVVLAASVAALFVLPKKYESSTLILVESEKVPESFVPRVATDRRSGRLTALEPEILSRTRLEQVVEETHPYPEVSSTTAAVQLVRRSISVNVTGNEGFTISFIHSDPLKAQEVTDRVATLFIEQTVRSREQQVAGAVDFLNAQVEAARKELEEKDEALRHFKEERMGRLPEQLQTNIATVGMLQREIQSIDESLFFAREKYEALVRNARRPASGPEGAAETEGAELAEMYRQLAALRARRYTDEHPDVQSLRKRIARLEAVSPEAPASPEQATGPTGEELRSVELTIRGLEQKRTRLEQQIASIRRNIEETPRTEQELATLTRDYDKLDENYVALLEKQLEAQMAGRLEQRWKGDRFRVLDPASLPERPVSPKPLIIIGLGLVLGCAVGLGTAVVIEFFDPTVKDAEDLEGFQGHPVLASIPHHPGLGGS